MTSPFYVFIGWDSRESVCSHVAAHSIKKRTSAPLKIEYLKHRDLRKRGLFSRPWLTNGESGESVDLIDGKIFSTEFSHTRFLIPHLMGYHGWALFMDADMIMLSDIKKLFALCDDKYAVMCVKHQYPQVVGITKMDNRTQTIYRRKNWSSFVLWNCGHEANRHLTPERVNFMKGGDLHALSWLHDNQIGELPMTYNFISGISPKLDRYGQNLPDVIHFTNGGPWFDTCLDVPYGGLWTEEYEDWQKNGAAKNFVSDVATMRYE